MGIKSESLSSQNRNACPEKSDCAIYSRKIVGWEVYAEESAIHASNTFRKSYLREGIFSRDLILHSDNGSPMKGATMLATLQKLGVMPSFSRPSVSNDNPYSEAMFKTLKYHPGFPDKPFDSLEEARLWVDGFQRWYNEEHRHSAIRFVTPGQRHRGEDKAILESRAALYEEARAKRPDRWTGNCRNWNPPQVVSLNPQKSSLSAEKKLAALKTQLKPYGSSLSIKGCDLPGRAASPKSKRAPATTLWAGQEKVTHYGS